MSKLLNYCRNHIQIHSQCSDWKEALKLASVPLLNAGKIKEKYVDAMIEQAQKLNFYIVLSEDIAMPHARPEEGVIESAISILKLEQGVSFKGDESIRLIVVLASKEGEEHIELIQHLGELFTQEEKIEAILNATNCEMIEKIIEEV